MDQNDFNKAIALMVGFLIGAWLAFSPVKAHATVTGYLTCAINPGNGVGCTGANQAYYAVGSVPSTVFFYTVPTGQALVTANFVYRGDAWTGTANLVACTVPLSGTTCSTSDWASTTVTSAFWAGSAPPDPEPSSVVCIPSARTIAPCPAGYAPSVAEPLSTNPSDQYTSAFDALPLQDMIYALGVALCGLFGVAVGVRLT